MIALATGLVAVAALSLVAFKGWIPEDEGTLGAAALAASKGQLPHVDYRDVYPGLQAILHAGFFAVFSPSVGTLRIALLSSAGVTAFSFYLLARYASSRRTAAVVGVGAVLLGIVFYPASMPTWWNVMIAAGCLALLLKARETNNYIKVAIAGFVTGLGILIKPVGVYVAVPTYLWLLSRKVERRRGSLELACFLALGVYTWPLLLSPSLGRFILIWLPVVLATSCIWFLRVPRLDGRPLESADKSLPGLYAASTVLPVLLVVTIYATIGELGALIEGWVTGPAARFQALQPDIPLKLFGVLVLGGFVVFALLGTRSNRRASVTVVLVATAVVWGTLGWVSFPLSIVAVGLWLSMALAISMIVRSRIGSLTPEGSLVASVAICFGLVQIPWWDTMYTAYTLPLLALAALFMAAKSDYVVAVCVALVGSLMVIQTARGLHSFPAARGQTVDYVQLDSSRGGISIPVWFEYYNELIPRVEELSGASGVYAGPDAPEVAFLAAVPSANDSLWEAVDPGFDPNDAVRFAEKGGPVVINSFPTYSDEISDDQLRRIRALLANSEVIGKFELRWQSDLDSDS